jgi:hypothetical protein
MVGREFVGELERHGFVVRRRSRSFVWVARGEQTLMLDEEATVPEGLLARLLAPHSCPPPTSLRPRASTIPAPRTSWRPSSGTMRPQRR